MDLKSIIQNWDKGFSVKQITRIESLSASPREFWRVISESGSSLVASFDPELTEEKIKTLINKADFFYHNGLITPRILYSEVTGKVVLWEDLGEDSLVQHIKNEQWDFEAFVQFTEEKMLPLWKRLWSAQPDSHWPYFGLSRYLFEWEFHGLKKAAAKVSLFDNEPYLLMDVIEVLISHIEKLIESRIVPIHRDFQSSNIFLCDDQVVLVDFQDAMNGHPLYDPVSYIFDSYTSYNFEDRLAFMEKVIDKYHTLIDPLRSKQELKLEGYFLIFQRKLHDVGAFIYSNEKTGNMQFLKFVKPGVDMVLAVARILNEAPLVAFAEALKESLDD